MRKLAHGVLGTAATAALLAAGAGVASANHLHSTSADGLGVDSSGVGSGASAQVPGHAPTVVCDSTVNAVGLLNPASIC
ncbi:chaplin [Streptomyces kaniharaensis]|uniref:Chaplin n=1 Tax=Streptomyces kaniharaensis TaxID=212423 RepID=A0A6N7KRZ7_9ACTN|nr:chaplin [Streptomyces kaniharaensis]MQS13575.1 chaplin [Streptomyces kaniharaensis]